jgi:uncharacterized protein (TIGR01244 family)
VELTSPRFPYYGDLIRLGQFMKAVQVTDKLSVATQPDLEEFGTIAEQGFKMLINNRPDGEDPIQPGSAAEQKAANGAGLGYAHIPVTGSTITEADVRRFQSVIAQSDGPVFAHCKGGTRSLTLWAIGEVLDGRLRPEDLRARGEALGFDLRNAEAWLARHAQGEE